MCRCVYRCAHVGEGNQMLEGLYSLKIESRLALWAGVMCHPRGHLGLSALLFQDDTT